MGTLTSLDQGAARLRPGPFDFGCRCRASIALVPIGRAYSPCAFLSLTWGVAPGWYGFGPLALVVAGTQFWQGILPARNSCASRLRPRHHLRFAPILTNVATWASPSLANDRPGSNGVIFPRRGRVAWRPVKSGEGSPQSKGAARFSWRGVVRWLFPTRRWWRRWWR
jgi:hypothetical protein